MLTAAAVPAHPRQLCFWVGLYSGLICLILMAAISIPTLQAMPLGSWRVVSVYFILVLSALGHNGTYFELLERTGAVATGILQALRAVLVFALSHVFYCDVDQAQCFTMKKGVATVVVVVGVLGFSWAKVTGRHERAGFQKVSVSDVELTNTAM